MFSKSGQSPDAQIYDLVGHVIKGTNARYEAFLKALTETDQEFIVTGILQQAARPAQSTQPIRGPSSAGVISQVRGL